MKTIHILLLFIFLVTAFACNDPDTKLTDGYDRFVIGTNITTASPVTGYVGTLKDLALGYFDNSKSRQTTQYPYVTVYKNDVFVLPQRYGDIVRKYTREAGGVLTESGSLVAPPASIPLGMVIENDSRGYCSLFGAGKILVINPSTMDVIETIDLTSYGLGDGNPDPNVMAFREGKLYVACSQTTDGFTSAHPVQVLIIDVHHSNTITSVVDARTTWAGSINEQQSMFFDEHGDLYIFCVASYGFGGPAQKCGFLRIKNGETSFDPTYFFNVADYNIADVPGNKVDYLQRMRYTDSGIVYATGNIYALASNPPDYINDRTYGAFKVDLRNQTIQKLGLPNSNGYAACVLPVDGKILWGLSTSSGIGIYSYDPETGVADTKPLVNTQGDPSIIERFDE